MKVLALALPFAFERPAWLWLCLAAPVLVIISLRSLAGLGPVRRALALCARCAVWLVLVAALADVQCVRRNDDLTVVFLMDRSASVASLQTIQEEYLHNVTKDKPKDDRAGVVSFARNAEVVQLPMKSGYVIDPGRLPTMPGADRTDLAAALRMAMAVFPSDTAKRIVLMSDGNSNMGDALSEARRAEADGIPIDILPLVYRHRNEIFFDRFIVPNRAEDGEQLPIRMVVHSHRRATGTIALYHNDQIVELPRENARVNLEPGANTLYMKLPVTGGGTHRFEARFIPDDPTLDAIPGNNVQTAFAFVAGPSRVLLVTSDPDGDAPLFEALQRENVRTELRGTAELGDFGLERMLEYSAIVLSNVPAADFTDPQHAGLTAYVKDYGGGLVMLGGDEGFGAGGWIGSPVEEVMPVSFEIKHKRVIPRGALVIIMHSCEMPRGNFWGKEMAKKSVDTISSQDYLGILAYTYSPGGVNWEVPLALSTNKSAVKAKIDRMQNGDMPDFASTMEMGLKELTTGRGRDAAQKHMIIISDGDPSPPSQQLLAQYKQSKITVSTIGIGFGSHVMAGSLQDIAAATNGKYYAPKDPSQLPQIFVKESKVVRRPLIQEDVFTPRLVQSDSELLAGLDPDSAIPPLGGLVLTSPKSSPNVQVPLIKKTSDGDDPVLAYWQCELGKAIAFTSGDWPRWGADWAAWTSFSKFWAQAIRWTMRQEAPANYDIYTRLDGNRGRVVVDALDDDARFKTQLQLAGKVTNPDGSPVAVQFTQVAPGRYEAEFDAEQSGNYIAGVQIRELGKEGVKTVGSIMTGLSVPFSPEFRDMGTNEAVLRQIAETSNGRWLDAATAPELHQVFSHDLPPSEAKRPVWEWVLAWLVLPLFLLDVSIRRLASWLAVSIAVEVVLLAVVLVGCKVIYTGFWGVLGTVLMAELVGWAIRFRYFRPMLEQLTQTVTSLGRAGERSTTSLQQLRTVRDAAREGMKGDPAQKVDQGPAERVAPDRTAAGRDWAAGASKGGAKDVDLREALGGAKPEGPDELDRPSSKDAPKGPAEDATSRLLRAKRRIKRDLDDQGKG